MLSYQENDQTCKRHSRRSCNVAGGDSLRARVVCKAIKKEGKKLAFLKRNPSTHQAKRLSFLHTQRYLFFNSCYLVSIRQVLTRINLLAGRIHFVIEFFFVCKRIRCATLFSCYFLVLGEGWSSQCDLPYKVFSSGKSGTSISVSTYKHAIVFYFLVRVEQIEIDRAYQR